MTWKSFWKPLFTGLSLWCFVMIPFLPAARAETLCAEVKIQISQELTLERQAFDAHMRIRNGLSHMGIENVRVDVLFEDKDRNPVVATTDPDATGATFFYRLDRMENIESVDGDGAVAPSTTADIHWMIIPVPGSANGEEAGALYFVGARLRYSLGGEEYDMTVTPDSIRVRPMPDIALDYFLPRYVLGDDPETNATEPVVPFELGVRVKNQGKGVARNLKIDSAQPKIVENKQGLLIDFAILSGSVNDAPSGKTLLVDFGDMAPDVAGMARWEMTASLAGRFVGMTAALSHADELGGTLTSLIRQENLNTHELVHSVKEDGKDDLRDFLAKSWEGSTYSLYASDGTTSDVARLTQPTLTPVSGISDTWKLEVTPVDGHFYLSVPDPTSGDKVLKQVTRADGKQVRSENAWTSKGKEKDGWRYDLHLFDQGGSGIYTLTFAGDDALPQAPVLHMVTEVSGFEEEELSVPVTATDANGTTPALSASPLPPGAEFADAGNGSGRFEWTPMAGQAGRYRVGISATDGLHNTEKRLEVRVLDKNDTDLDGMDDAWERYHFGTLDRDGTGDFDGDGILDIDEFKNGTDPKESNAPSAPVIHAPLPGTSVETATPVLTVANALDPDEDDVTYIFELSALEDFSEILATETVGEGADITSWTVPEKLAENGIHFWRVRATDGIGFSLWVYGDFRINATNEAPGAVSLVSPEDGLSVDLLNPKLICMNANDPDGDTLSYTFEIFSDASLSTRIAFGEGIPENPEGQTSWMMGAPLADNQVYFWRVTATDPEGLTSTSPVWSFFVNTANDAPESPDPMFPLEGSEVSSLSVRLQVHNATDLDGDALHYLFEVDTTPSFDSPAKRSSGLVSEQAEQTGWEVVLPADNTLWFWRAKATDGLADSPWCTGTFFANLANDPPTVPGIRNPGEGSWVSTLTPTFELTAAEDIDRDALHYEFEIRDLFDPSVPAISGESVIPSWTIAPELSDNRTFSWKARAVDEHGLGSDWTATSTFFTDENGVDDTPEFHFVGLDDPVHTNADTYPVSWTDRDPDSNARITIYRNAEASGTGGTAMTGVLFEDPDGVGDETVLDLSNVPEGTWFLYAEITDDTSRVEEHATSPLIIDRTDPVVTISPNGGVFYTSQTITLSLNETGTIHFTLDGTEPTTDSLVYQAPIAVSETTTIRFMAVDLAGNRSETESSTFVLNEIPSVPVVKAPKDGQWVGSTQPVLEVHPPEHVSTDAITYEFEVYADRNLTRLQEQAAVSEPRWQVSGPLEANRDWYWRVRAKDGYGMAGEWSLPVSFHVNLSSSWQSGDVGHCWKKGYLKASGDRFEIGGGGFDIWALADSFHFASQPLVGDGEIRVRVDHLDDTNKWAKAGVMIRESLRFNSKHAMMVTTPREGTAFQHRYRTAWVTKHVSGASGCNVPCWLRIVRQGNRFTGYQSSDGNQWQEVASAEIAMDENVFIGLAVTSHNNFKRATAVFREPRILRGEE